VAYVKPTGTPTAFISATADVACLTYFASCSYIHPHDRIHNISGLASDTRVCAFLSQLPMSVRNLISVSNQNSRSTAPRIFLSSVCSRPLLPFPNVRACGRRGVRSWDVSNHTHDCARALSSVVSCEHAKCDSPNSDTFRWRGTFSHWLGLGSAWAQALPSLAVVT
jgi:hypothetical protein